MPLKDEEKKLAGFLFPELANIVLDENQRDELYAALIARTKRVLAALLKQNRHLQESKTQK